MPDSNNPFELIADFEARVDKKLDEVAASIGSNQPRDLTLPKNPVTVAPRVKSADDWAEKQVTNAKNAGDRWLKGVLSPRKNPVTAAIAADTKRKQKLEEAERQGKWKKAMQQVNVDQMYETIEKGGSSAFTTGVSKREGKIKEKISKLQPLVLANAEEIDKMPQDTPEQREAKMIANKRGMEKIGQKLRGITG